MVSGFQNEINNAKDYLIKGILKVPIFFSLIIFVALGFFLIWIGFTYFQLHGEIIFTTLLLLPFILYLILSDKILELKTPGGLEIKFRESAKANILDSSIQGIQNLTEATQDIVKSSPLYLKNDEEKIDPFKPLNFKIYLPRISYDLSVMEEYLKMLIRHENFKFVVFVDKEERLISFTSSKNFYHLIFNDSQQGSLIIQFLNNNQIELINQISGISTRALNKDVSNLDALKLMNELNLDSMLVIDKERKIVGIVPRDRIIADMILKISS